MNKDKSAILAEITRIKDDNKLFEIFEDSEDFEIRYSIVNLINDDSILYEIFSIEKDSLIKSAALNRISTDVLNYDAFNSLDEQDKITYIETHSDESLFCEIAEKDNNFHVRVAAILKISDRDFLLKLANCHNDYSTRVVLYKKLNGKSILDELSWENLAESHINLVDELDNGRFLDDVALNDPDSDVRRIAVEKVTDRQVLSDIAIKDTDLEVKKLALKKLNKPHFYANLMNASENDELKQLIGDINDESQLRDLALFLSSNRLIVEHAINNISDASRLFELYCRGPASIRKTLIKKLVFGNVFSNGKIADKIGIGDMLCRICRDDVLKDIARNDDDLCYRIIPYIRNEDVLIDILMNNSSEFARKNAVKLIRDEDALAEAARNDSDYVVRRLAVEKIADEDVLEEVARNDLNSEVRRIAVKMICDEDVLAYVAKNDPNGSVRSIAVEKIIDEDVLADVARNGSDEDIRRIATEKIRNRDILEDIIRNYLYVNIEDGEDDWAFIARNDPVRDVRIDAVKRIRDEDVLADIAKNDSSEDVRIAAVKRITDEDVLVDIARNDSSDEVQIFAVKNITDDDVLVDIARNTKFWWVGSQAVHRINDKDILADFARNDQDAGIRRDAVKRISDEDVLLEIFSNDSDREVRRNALDNINDADTLKRLVLDNYGYLSVNSYSSFKRNYDNLIYESIGTGVYDDILDKLSDESVFIDLVHEKLFGDFRILLVRRIVSSDVLRDLALNDSDYRVRMEAVKNPHLCDKNTFVRILRLDVNDGVRFEALRRIDDEDIPDDLVNDLNPLIRLYAYERVGNDFKEDENDVAFEDIDLTSIKTIEDENVLCTIVKNSPLAAMRKYAFDKISDEHILADLACFNGEFMNRALNRITDNALLLDIALYSTDLPMKRNAVKKIDDEEFLLKAVQNNPYNDISEYIVDSIRDESLLEIIASNNSNPYNRKAAVNKIKSQYILTCLGEIESEEVVCTAIIRKTQDKDLLEYMGLSNPCKTVRRYVASVTDDEDLLYKLAFKEYEFDNRREMISKLTNEEYIYNLLKREVNGSVFNPDLEITNPEMLIDLAKNSFAIHWARGYALKNIKDKSIKMDFLYCSPFCSRTPKDKSIWEGIQYNNDDFRLCLSILNDSKSDMRLIEDFLIENQISPCGELFELVRNLTEISSMYKIALNCKSTFVRNQFKYKLKYDTEDEDEKKDGDDEVRGGLGVLFG